jgi:hypothetical protein
MCSVEWSESGTRAVRGRDVNYFSPEVYLDSEGIPNGLPDKGPAGGVVCEPAFRNIPRLMPIAASVDLDHADACADRILAGETLSDRDMESLVAAMEADGELYLDILAGIGSSPSPSRQDHAQTLSASEVLSLEVESMKLICGGMTAAEEAAFAQRVMEDPAVHSAYDRVRCNHYSRRENLVTASHGPAGADLQAGMRRLVAGEASEAESEVLHRALEQSSEAYGVYLRALQAA